MALNTQSAIPQSLTRKSYGQHARSRCAQVAARKGSRFSRNRERFTVRLTPKNRPDVPLDKNSHLHVWSINP